MKAVFKRPAGARTDSQDWMPCNHFQLLGWLLFFLLIPGSGFSADILPVDLTGAAMPSKVEGPRAITLFNEEAGISERTIFDLAFESNGTVWLASSDGLLRYDGYFWQEFGLQEGLPSRFTRSVLVTKQGQIWVGTDKGIARLNGGRFIIPIEPHQLAGPSVRRIVEDNDGALWFCSDSWPDSTVTGGLTLFKNGVWKTFTQSEGLPSPHILNLFKDKSGRTFALSSRPTGISELKGNRWEPLVETSSEVWSLAETDESGVIGFSGEQLLSLKNSGPQIFQHSFGFGKPICATRDQEIVSCLIAQGKNWFARWNGRQWERISPTFHTRLGFIERIVEAPDGAIWCAADRMVVRWDRQNESWTEYRNLPPPRFADKENRVHFFSAQTGFRSDHNGFTPLPGLPSNAFISRAGTIWAWQTNTILSLKESLRGFSTADHGFEEVNDCREDDRGILWSYGKNSRGAAGVSTFDGNSWHTRSNTGLMNQRHVASFPHSSGMYYLTATSGSVSRQEETSLELIKFEDQSAKIFPVKYGGSVYSDPKLAFDSEGTAWLFGVAGLYQAKSAAGPWKKINGPSGNRFVRALSTSQGLWFIFDGRTGGRNGLGRWNVRVWEEFLIDVQEDAAVVSGTSVYVASKSSVYFFPEGTFHPHTRLSVPDQMQVQTLVAEKDLTLWLGVLGPAGEQTVYRYRPRRTPPGTMIKGLSSNIQQDGRLQFKVVGIQKFVPYNQHENYRFSWRFDQEAWSPFSTFPEKGLEVAHLNPGKHRLEVRSQSEAFEIDPIGAVADFSISPVPIQLRKWFRPVVLTAVIFAVCLALLALERARQVSLANRSLKHEIEIRQMAQKELACAHEELEKRVQERTEQLQAQISAREEAEITFNTILGERNRISRELHDILEQGLAGVGLQIEAAVELLKKAPDRLGRHLELIRTLVKHSQTEVRRSIWDLRSGTLDKQDLAGALTELSRQVTQEIPLKIQVAQQGPSHRLDEVIESNLYRIAQESITNAIKHSRGTRIDVLLDFQPGQLVLRIADNGEGMDPTKIGLQPGHFGFVGMKERAKRIGAVLKVESAEAHGTTVSVNLPLEPAKK